MTDFSFFFGMGWEHIVSLDALDHILFVSVLAAIYLLRDWKKVLILVTAFTIGHTITLALAAKNILTISSSLVEFLVPITIIITAVSNLFIKRFNLKAIRINYFLALFFGLIHGMAFANLLRDILASDQNFVTSMLSFSLGLELGQILVVLIVLLLGQLVVGILNLNRRIWVAFVSIVAFGFALKMAIERFPGKRDSTTSFTINSHNYRNT